jgi:hypothetical protein
LAADPILDETTMSPLGSKRKSKDVLWSSHNTFTSPGADKEMVLIVDMPIGRKLKLLRIFVYHQSGSTEWFKVFIMPKKNTAALKAAISGSDYRPGAVAAETFKSDYGGVFIHTDNITTGTQTAIDIAKLEIETEYSDLVLCLGGIENADYCETTVLAKAVPIVKSLN